MSPFAGPLFAGAGLLAAAGVLKLARPGSAARALRSAGLPGSRAAGRALGVAEFAIALTALALGGRVAAALVAACYVGFALFVVRLRRTVGAQADCGCFGAETSPVSGIHVVANAALAGVALGAVAWPTRGVLQVMRSTPLAGLPFLGFTALAGWLVFVALTLVPDLQAAAGTRATRR